MDINYCICRSTNCHKIGYAARRNKKVNAEDKGMLWTLHFCNVAGTILLPFFLLLMLLLCIGVGNHVELINP